MTTPRVPTGFRPSIQRYGFGSATGIFMTEVGGALPRPSRRWRRGTALYNVTMVLTRVRFNVWQAFYYGIIQEGAIQFQLPLDTQGGILEDHLCILVGSSYRVEQASGQKVWNVNFDVVAEPSMSGMSEEDAQEIIGMWELYGESAERILDALSHLDLVKLTQLGAVL